MKRLLSQNNLVWSILALAAVLVFNFFFTAGFFHVWHSDGKLYGSIIDVAKNGTPVLLLALGMTLVIATGGVDLSVGAIMAISGSLMAVLISRPADSPLSFINIHGSAGLALAIALIAGIVAGTFNGSLVSLLGIQPIIATLILMVTGRGIAQLIARIENVPFNNPTLLFIANGFVFRLPFPITLAVAMIVLTYLLTRVTGLGLLIESVGDNPVASEFCGANTKLIKTFAYAFSGFCAGLAGVVAASDIKGATATTVGLYLELDAILAVVLGGTALIGGRFSIVGSVLGAILIQTLNTTVLMHNISQSFTLMIKALVIVAVCLLQAPALRQMLARPRKGAA